MMTAIAGRLYGLIYLCIGVFVLTTLLRDDHPVWLALLAALVAIGIVIASIYGVILGCGFLISHAQTATITHNLLRKSPPSPPQQNLWSMAEWRERIEQYPNASSWLNLVRAYLSEVWVSMKMFNLDQAWFACTRIRRPRVQRQREHQQANLPVLLIHGYMCNAGVWRTTQRQLKRLGITSLAVSLEPPFCSIDHYMTSIDEAIATLRSAAGSHQVNVIGHSMGGLVIRAWVRARGHEQIHHVCTLGSPHAGTAMSALGLGDNVRQMQWLSNWLHELSNHPHDLTLRRKMTCFWAHHDNIISPPQSSILPNATVIGVPDCGHLALIEHASFRQWLNENLK